MQSIRTSRIRGGAAAAGRTALVIASDSTVAGQCRSLAAACAYQLLDGSSAQPAVDLDLAWRDADVVLVGVHDLQAVIALDPPRRPHVYALADRAVPDEAWRDCVALGVEEAVAFTDAQEWLVTRLSLIGEQSRGGVLVGVIGSCGGVGASTFAAAAALSAVLDEQRTLLIDTDQRGGWLDKLLGTARPGVGWRELAGVSGRISAGSLEQAVTTYGGVPVLTFDRDQPMDRLPAQTVRSVMSAAAGSFDVTFVDLGGIEEHLASIAVTLDALVVVCQQDPRAAAATASLLTDVAGVATQIVVAVRRCRRYGLPDAQIHQIVPDEAQLVWISELRRLARRVAAGDAGILPDDALVIDAGLVVRSLLDSAGER